MGSENVKYEEEYVLNSRGLKLFTCRWLPVNQEPKALVFLCHGYAMESSVSMRVTGTRLAGAGFEVHGVDYEGHGKSFGLLGFVNSFDDVVSDCTDYFTSIAEKKENKKKMRFVMGESMGGAVALLLHRKKPDYWDGAVLSAPMCKIADEMRPNQVVITVLNQLTKIIPTWRIVPTQDIIDVAFREPAVRKEIRENKYCYKGRPRLKTASELLRVSLEIEQRLSEVSLPFLVLHGEEDKVTDISVSRVLYESAASSDKEMKTYPGMWHSLIYGEKTENIDVVFHDIIAWLDDKALYGNSRLENEQKQSNDVAGEDSSDKKQ
uniref:Serine aminopeptidase S33 domain-containing protein n=1 Tax=Kalanchoe fedtschenkoi TaxID=63787 RepID=A0A7N0ZZW5_KALFE